ncbi:MAG: DUF4124 domain-containing protein [Parahaliea sp.]
MEFSKRLLATLSCGLLASTAVTAQIYKSVDEHGNVVFSDQPSGDVRKAEQVELNTTNTTTPPRPVSRPHSRPEPTTAEAVNYRVSITSPANGTTIPMGTGNFSVSAAASPALTSGQTLQLQIDGQDHGGAQASGSWQLTNIFRGEHQLTVQRKSREGEVLATSEAITVYVHRPSVHFRRK